MSAPRGRQANATPRVWRWPALVALPLLVVAALVVSTREGGGSGDQAPGLAQLAMPTVAATTAPGATWFCAGGAATAAGSPPAQEHVVVMANTSDGARTARLTAYPAGGQPVVREVDLEARTRRDIRLHELLDAAHVAALVEVDGGGVAVQHEVRGPAGRSVAPCASAPAASWYFPAGTTRAGSHFTLSLFNPFPTDAVVDVTFDADDGSRSPEDFQGLVVPAGTVLPVDVGAVVTLREELATNVHVRAGRIVADQLLAGDGLSVVLGGVLGERSWIFPGGAGVSSRSEAVVLYNPNGEVAEVEVQALLDDPGANGVPEPFEVSVGPHRYEVVDVLSDGRVPSGVGHSIVVRSTNGVSVVAERAEGSADGSGRGSSLAMGSPAAATRWVAAAGGLEDTTAASLTVVNPMADRETTVRIALVLEGSERRIDEITLGPGERRVMPLPLGAEGSSPAASLVVDADEPVVVEARFAFANGYTSSMASPVIDTIVTPEPSALFVPADLLATGSGEG